MQTAQGPLRYVLQVRVNCGWSKVKKAPLFASDFQAFRWLGEHPEEYVQHNGWRVRRATSAELENE